MSRNPEAQVLSLMNPDVVVRYVAKPAGNPEVPELVWAVTDGFFGLGMVRIRY